ncbi:MAG: response regulator [Spirochaetaceae bacterium]|jgi:CheY-like chemotaxis protein|nr:response regulator [Spirochaetaceae bacterium]
MSELFDYERKILAQNISVAEKKDAAEAEKKVILAVDDMPEMLNNIASILGKQYTVLLAKDGWTAIELLKVRHVDLVLLDHGMSKVSGTETLKEIRKIPKLADIPVVFVSATINLDFIQKTAALKPAGYVVKPIEPEALRKTVMKVLGENLV